jgi:formate/nitrite transporter FocA (FNT family)
MIVLFQADLVTASQAVFILSTLKRKVPIWAFLVDWTIVFIGNLAGALLFAGFVTGGQIYSQTPVIKTAAANAGNSKMAVGFGEIREYPPCLSCKCLCSSSHSSTLVIRGIGCNMLVVIAVFQASLMKDGVSKIAASHFPIFVFVAAGFDHVVGESIHLLFIARLLLLMLSFTLRRQPTCTCFLLRS